MVFHIFIFSYNLCNKGYIFRSKFIKKEDFSSTSIDVVTLGVYAGTTRKTAETKSWKWTRYFSAYALSFVLIFLP